MIEKFNESKFRSGYIEGQLKTARFDNVVFNFVKKINKWAGLMAFDSCCCEILLCSLAL